MSGRILCGLATVEPGNGGISSVSRMALASLASSGWRVKAISLHDKGAQTVAGIPVQGCGGSKALFALRLLARAWSYRVFFYDTAGVSRAHPSLPWMRKIMFLYGIEVWGNVRPDYARCLRSSDRLVSISHYTLARATESMGPLPQAKVCWLATEEDDEPLPGAVTTSQTVLILARITGENYKGHRELVEIWPKVVAAVPQARLVIAGRGEGVAELQARVAASPVAESIEMKGFVPQDELDALWREAAVFAMPSRGEGFGLVYVDAMRRGIPVIASTHDAGAEVNVDGVTGFNVSMEDKEMLADRLIQLLSSPQLRAEMGEAGRRRWREHFRFTAFRERFLAMMSLLLAPKRQG